MTNELRGGDYRRVTKETWDAFVKLYPGSGPAITMVYNYDVKCHSSGYYPTEEFIIIDPPPNPYPKENASIFSWFSTKVSGSEAVITNPLHEVDDGAEDKGTEVRSVVGDVPDEVDFSLKSVETTPLRPVRNDLREKYGVTPERPLSTTINPHPTDITPKLSTNAPHVDSSNSIPPPLSTISFSTNAADSKDDDMMLTDRSYISSAANPRPRDLNDKLLADQEARQKLLSVKQQNFQSAISMRSFTSSAASKR